MPFNTFSEYIGQSLEEQRASIARSWRRFKDEGIHPPLFMAPAHSLDDTTLQALRAETDISWITDGISWRPFKRKGFNWLPQQFFRLRRPPPIGAWTVCLHPNTMTTAAVDAFAARLARLKALVVQPQQVLGVEPAEHGAADRAFESAYWRLAKLKWVADGQPAQEH